MPPLRYSVIIAAMSFGSLAIAMTIVGTIQTLSTPADRDITVTPPDWLGQRPPVEGDWMQTFHDDFTGDKLNEQWWTPSNKDKTYGPIYLYTPEGVSVKDGSLHLTAQKKAVEKWDYISGQVDGFGKWTQTYGYFEARMKWPHIVGLFPAFWMMPDRDIHGSTEQQAIWDRNTTKRNGMEYDIMEHIVGWGAGRYSIAAHWDGYQDLHKTIGNDHIYYGPTKDGWHVFGMLWEPGKLTWYCDGIKKGEWTDARVGSIPSYFILSMQMGGWGIPEEQKRPAADQLPAALEVDYVRAWQLKPRIAD